MTKYSSDDTEEYGTNEEFRTVDTLSYDDNVEKDYVPDGFKTVEAFLQDARDEYQKDLDYDRINREEAIDDKRFAAGEQWDPVVKEQRKGLPCLTINSIPQFVAQLVGDWRENKNGIKVLPAEDGDVDVASIREDLVRAIQTNSRATRVFNHAFENMVQCGDGAFRVSVDYARNSVFDQEISLKQIDDPLSVVWDRFAIDDTGRDARHVFVDDRLSMKEFEKKWPDLSPSELGEEYLAQLAELGWVSDDSVRVTEYWRMIERKKKLALFENGKVFEINDGNLEELVQRNGPITRTREAPVSFAQLHLITGHAILSGPYEYQLNRVPIVRMSGRSVNIAGRRVRYGLVRFMKDSVRLKNFWRSVSAEQLGYAPKAQWIATESAVEGREDQIRKAHLTRDPLIVVNDEAIIGQNLQRLDPPVPQTALLNEAQVNAQDMKDVTGIHDASLGIKSNEVSGRAIQARQREGDIASLAFYDNGNNSILESGDVINQLIGQVYDGTRILRIVGEDEAVKFVRINDPSDPSSPDMSVGSYDTALDSGTSYTTRRVEAAQSMMEAIQVWPQLIQVAGDIVAKAQDWPGADKLAERLKKTIPQQFLDPEEQQANGVQLPPPEAVQEMQVTLEKLAKENEDLKRDKALEARKLGIMAFDAETKRMAVEAKAEIDDKKVGIDAVKSAMQAEETSIMHEQKMTAAAQQQDRKEKEKQQSVKDR